MMITSKIGKQLQRIGALALCCCLTAGLLSGCGSEEAASAAADPAGSASVVTQSTAEPDNGTASAAAEAAEAGTADAAENAGDNADAENTGNTENAENAEAAVQELPALSLPYEVDEGRLLVTAVFQSSLPNPDCNEEEGENIGTLEVVNQSGSFLDSAVFDVTLTDGTVLSFEADSIPDGATVWALDRSNTAVVVEPAVAEITCTAFYLDGDTMLSDQLQTEADGTTLTFTNLTGDTISGAEVQVHTLMDGVIFGGTVYSYALDDIPAGEAAVVDAVDCWLGEAEAVRITTAEG